MKSVCVMDNRFFKKDSQDDQTGYASSPDAKSHYTVSNQNLWNTFSQAVIKELSLNLDAYPENPPELSCPYDILKSACGCAYTFLADKRAHIARELEHGKDSNRTGWYGHFRKETFESLEKIYATNETVWAYQKDKIFEIVQDLIQKASFENQKEIEFKNWKIHKRQKMAKKIFDEGEFDPNEIVTEYKIQILSTQPAFDEQNINYTSKLSTITLYDFNQTKANNIIVIEYTSLNKHQLPGDYLLADQYFNACRNWKQEDGIEIFLMNAGCLCHLLAHLLPVMLGNAAITEWMVRALAENKGIELGPFNYKEGISWDIKALLTPDREEYAAWYAKNAFSFSNIATHTHNYSPYP